MDNIERAEKIGPTDSDVTHGGDDNDAQTNAGDLMGNFFHWCVQHRVEPIRAFKSGYFHFREEALGTDGEKPYRGALKKEASRVLKEIEDTGLVGD